MSRFSIRELFYLCVAVVLAGLVLLAAELAGSGPMIDTGDPFDSATRRRVLLLGLPLPLLLAVAPWFCTAGRAVRWAICSAVLFGTTPYLWAATAMPRIAPVIVVALLPGFWLAWRLWCNDQAGILRRVERIVRFP